MQQYNTTINNTHVNQPVQRIPTQYTKTKHIATTCNTTTNMDTEDAQTRETNNTYKHIWQHDTSTHITRQNELIHKTQIANAQYTIKEQIHQYTLNEYTYN